MWKHIQVLPSHLLLFNFLDILGEDKKQKKSTSPRGAVVPLGSKHCLHPPYAAQEAHGLSPMLHHTWHKQRLDKTSVVLSQLQDPHLPLF